MKVDVDRGIMRMYLRATLIEGPVRVELNGGDAMSYSEAIKCAQDLEAVAKAIRDEARNLPDVEIEAEEGRE